MGMGVWVLVGLYFYKLEDEGNPEVGVKVVVKDGGGK